MTKFEDERNILKMAAPFLEELYGQFKEDVNQTDKPDAAITLTNADSNLSMQIGIEITSIDRHADQQYLNDEKFTQKIIIKQLDDLIQNGSYSKQPLKKISIDFDRKYIFDGVVKKSGKYENYAANNKYHEIIVLAFSDHMTMDNEYFDEYHRPWARYLLSQCNFPFDKVIFVCKKKRAAALIFDKKNPRSDAPEVDTEKEQGITKIQSGVRPVGKVFNIYESFDHAPLVPKGKSSKK